MKPLTFKQFVVIFGLILFAGLVLVMVRIITAHFGDRNDGVRPVSIVCCALLLAWGQKLYRSDDRRAVVTAIALSTMGYLALLGFTVVTVMGAFNIGGMNPWFG